MSASIPVLAIRPQPGLDDTLKRARAMGLDAHGCALSEIRPRPWAMPMGQEYDGLLLGSANAVRHAGPALADLAELPAWCVGQATAQAAQEAGMAVAEVGSGGLQRVLDGLAGRQLHLLRIAGADHVELTAPPGVSFDAVIAYENAALPLAGKAVELLRGPCVVLLHSAVSAGHFAAEVDRLDLDRSAIALAAIGPRVVPAVGKSWAMLRPATRPDDAALLALAHDMCQEMAD